MADAIVYPDIRAEGREVVVEVPPRFCVHLTVCNGAEAAAMVDRLKTIYYRQETLFCEFVLRLVRQSNGF